MIQNQASPAEEYRQSFLRHLINRIEAVEQRIQRFGRDGWDMAAISVLHDDVQRLAGSAGRYDLIIASQRLLLLEQALSDQIARNSLPDPEMGDRMLALLGMVTAALATLPDYQKIKGRADASAAEVPLRAPAAAIDPEDGTATDRRVTERRTEPAQAADPGWSTSRRIYLVSDGNDVAADVAQRLQAEGFDVEAVGSPDELQELLTCVAPELILLDASCIADLRAVGAARRDILHRSQDKDEHIRLVAVAPQDSLQIRLDARRAGVEALLFPPCTAAEIARWVQAHLAPQAEEVVRVLVVEDDRIQALFAQTVLTNAGMEAQVELEPMRVLDAIATLRPDLILMDLHMPDANGVELTALIRENPDFMDTPIVFLTGEKDPHARSEAINAGGDDYLSKPIRPKALIAAVHGRVRRRRAIVRRDQDRQRNARDEATGLYRRAYFFDRANDAIGAASDLDSHVGGVLFLEIDAAADLRERYGLAALEHLLAEAGRLLAAAVGDRHLAALINDNAFVVLASDLDDAGLEALARRLRDELASQHLEADSHPVRLTASVGICPLRYQFDDASVLINTAERACRQARAAEQGVRTFEPSQAPGQNPQASLAQQLRDAISSNGFGLIYQPIAAMQGSHDAQYQTLLRLRDPSGQLVPAAAILPLAERAGLMIDIDQWVLRRAMSVAARQFAMGRSVRLFVPQALTTFAAKHQDAFVKAELAAHHLAGSALVLECRLADALLNPPALLAFARALTGSGVQLCLGQYEHTAEADRLLEQLPLGFIKLAAKYVAEDAPREVRDELRVVSDRAHRYGIHVIGHQVEDQHTAAALWLSGIDYIQGNFVQGAVEEMMFDFNAAIV